MLNVKRKHCDDFKEMYIYNKLFLSILKISMISKIEVFFPLTLIIDTKRTVAQKQTVSKFRDDPFEIISTLLLLLHSPAQNR